MTADRAHDLVDVLCGEPDAEAVRQVEVLHAHAAALAWIGQATDSYPAPGWVAERLQEAADQLRAGTDERDPRTVLVQVAALALAGGRTSAA